MDNNFYPAPRRSRERETVKKSFMGKIIAVQLILCLLITGVLFLVCRGDGETAQGIKTLYAKCCETDLSAKQIADVFKRAVKFTFAPAPYTDNSGAGEAESETGERAVFSPVYFTVPFVNPLKTIAVNSHYGYRVSPITNKYSFHSGVDLKAGEGEEIFASLDGTVIKSEYNSVNGNYIVIEHSPHLKTAYNHCSELLVKQGDKVKSGEIIALAGSTGAATGSHLHFSVILNGKYVNPLWALSYEL